MSEEEKQGISINFGLEAFEILKYEYKGSEKDIDLKELGFQVQFKHHADIEGSTFSIEFKITAQLGRDKPVELGHIITRTTYSLSNMDDLINEDGDFILPKGLAITLLSIALSTTRGALVAKSEENILSEAILPLADPKEMYETSPLKGELDVK
ncbi:hypothetical protein [Fodinibius sp.]|uniref:hypothetical protein n=1 Tax=Fodinibius sp. TaxID=1872440 RepID=UPI002ACEC80A|nr:hypothetical protein [Fodinibius sp.]MDZ7660392.1 hypothetical protein [Fodinibius sp.]